MALERSGGNIVLEAWEEKKNGDPTENVSYKNKIGKNRIIVAE